MRAHPKAPASGLCMLHPELRQANPCDKHHFKELFPSNGTGNKEKMGKGIGVLAFLSL